ncbi:hypothetical protein ABW19_dt0204377 [Dactylella cylindrospora]|nr:hypothetical protein ABW19_dt0204377 [Dactylella cylindrospora]
MIQPNYNQDASPSESQPLLRDEATSYSCSRCYETNAKSSESKISSPKQPDEEATKDDSLPVRQTPPGFWGVIACLLIGVIIANADTSLVMATFGQIGSEFGRLDDANWMIVGYQLGLLSTQPMYGKLSDIFGRKALLLFAYTLFGAGCFWIGSSTEFWHIIAGRVISGIGGAGMTCVVSILLNDLIPLRDLAAWRSYVYLAATVGRATGAPLGGFMVDTIGWRWSFLGQVPMALFAIVLVAGKLDIKESKNNQHVSLKQRFQRIDFLGASSLAASICLLLVFLDEAGKRLDLTNPLLIFSGIGSIVMGILFVVIEAYVANEPILSLQILTNRDVASVYSVLGLTTGSQIAMITTVSLYFVVTLGVSNANAAARLIPGNIAHALGGLSAGVIIKRSGRYKRYMIMAISIAGLALFLITVRWRGHTNIFETGYIALAGLGAGMINTIAFTALSASVGQEDQAMATAGFYLSDNLGFVAIDSLGNAVLQLALKERLSVRLRDVPDKDDIIHQVVSSLWEINELPGAIREKAIKAFVEALQWDHGKTSTQ